MPQFIDIFSIFHGNEAIYICIGQAVFEIVDHGFISKACDTYDGVAHRLKEKHNNKRIIFVYTKLKDHDKCLKC